MYASCRVSDLSAKTPLQSSTGLLMNHPTQKVNRIDKTFFLVPRRKLCFRLGDDSQVIKNQLYPRDAGSCELIGPFVFWVPCVSFDPMPCHRIEGAEPIQFLPQILIFDRIFFGRTPPILLPPRDPGRDPISDILTVGVDMDRNRAFDVL